MEYEKHQIFPEHRHLLNVTLCCLFAIRQHVCHVDISPSIRSRYCYILRRKKRNREYNFDTNSYNSTNTHTQTCLIEEVNERNKIKALRCKSHEIFMFPFSRWNFFFIIFNATFSLSYCILKRCYSLAKCLNME